MPQRIARAHTFFVYAAAAISALIASANLAAQTLPAFSGAEGFGGTFAGTAPAGGWFSNATIYHVTNLNDSGTGSLRAAFGQNSSNKIIVFDVGGTIKLTSGKLDIKNLSNYYIAGQTAPSPISITGGTTDITASNNKLNQNVIVRYMSFRGSDSGGDAFDFVNGGTSPGPSTNMIADHISATWSEDEAVSVAGYNTNVTVQNSIIAEALNNADHGFGSLIRPQVDSNVSYLGNVYANNKSRNPRPGSYNGATTTFDFRNNTVYNWSFRAGYTGGSTESDREKVNLNLVANNFVVGPQPFESGGTTTPFVIDKNSDLTAYQSGNFWDPNAARDANGLPVGSDPGSSTFQVLSSTNAGTLTLAQGPFATTGVPVATLSASAAYNEQVLQDGHGYVGNAWWGRDQIDTRIVNDVKTNQGAVISTPPQNDLDFLNNQAMTSRAANWDADNDGMPGIWETSMGLNPALASDALADADTDGYVNVQEYLDEIGAFPAPGPIVFTGSTDNRFSKITNWNVNAAAGQTTNWQPSRFDEVQINSGTAVVDAVGQHAGTLKISAISGGVASLNITSGWLQVEQELDIGTNSSKGTLNLSGGELTVATLAKGSGGEFNFTGGKLHAGLVTFNLVDNGGTIAPGNRAGAVTIVNATPVALSTIGQTHVQGNLTMQSGTMEIELASTSSFDKVAVDGVFTPGGTLAVSLSGSFVPAVGNKFDIMDWTTRSGKFTTLSLPTLSSPLVWNTTKLYTIGELSVIDSNYIPGDLNRDSQVTAADVSALMTALSDLTGYQSSHTGMTDPQHLLQVADLNGDNVVTNTDIQALIALIANNAAVNGSGGGSGDLSTVPEPATLVLAALGMVGLVAMSRRDLFRKKAC